MSTPIQLTPGSLPSGYCPSTFQQLYNQMFALASASIDLSVSFFIISKTEPDPEDRDKAWIKRNDDGGDGSLERLYLYWDGKWIAPHPVPINSSERRIWTGTELELETYDGGTALVVGEEATTGPFWEVDTDFETRVPVGAGTLPSTTVLAVGDAGGSERVTLAQSELPATLTLVTTTNNWASSSYNDVTTQRVLSDSFSEGGTTIDVSTQIANSGGSQSHQNMQPYKVVYFIKRTSRKFYVGS